MWHRVLATLCATAALLAASCASIAAPARIAWDAHPGWPAGTTVELRLNGESVTGITGTEYSADLPAGQPVEISARAVSPDGESSGWTSIGGTWPLPVTGLHATQEPEQTMAVEYFGHTGITNNVLSPTGYTWDVNNTYTITSPGTTAATYRVVSLEMYTRADSGSPTLRIGLYSTGLSLLCQGAAAATLNTTAGWKGHASTSDIQPAGGAAGDACYIQGGTNFKVALARNGAIYFYTGGSLGFTNSWRYSTANDYATAGYPSTISIPAAQDYVNGSWAVRIGVELVSNEVLAPAAGITVAGVAPTISTGASAAVPAGSVGVAGLAPTISTGARVAMPAATIALAGLAPSIDIGVGLLVPAADVAVAGLAPTVSAGAHVAVPVGAVGVAGVAPTISAGANVAVPAGAVEIAANAPTINAGVHVAVPAATIALAGLAPSIDIGAGLLVPAADVAVAGLAPTVSAGAHVAVPAGAVGIAALPPGIATGTHIRVPAAGIAVLAYPPIFGDLPTGFDRPRVYSRTRGYRAESETRRYRVRRAL